MQVLPAKKIGNFIIAGKRIDVQADEQEKKPPKNGKDLQTIDVDSIRNKDVREVGSEWLTFQAPLNSNYFSGLAAKWVKIH